MKVLILTVLLALTACNEPVKMNDITIGTNGIEKTWDKGVSDVRNEYDNTENRVSDTLAKANDDVLDTAAKANADAVDEEHRTTGRTKETLAKANSDVLDEEARTTGRVKDTLAKANGDVLDTAAQANEDAVEEEHKFNDRSKTTAKKANMDTIAEGDKLTDRIVGSDDKTVDQHGDEIRDLQRRMALVEQVNQSQNALLSLYLQQMADGDAQSAKDIFDLRTDLSALTGRVGTAESKISVLETLSSGLRTDLGILQGRVTATEEDILVSEDAIDALYDQINGENGVLDRLDNAESDIHDLQVKTKKLRKKLNKLKNYVHGCLENRIQDLESAVSASCELTVSDVTNFKVTKCTNTVLGICAGNQSRILYSAKLKFECLGKEAQYIDNVLFETDPTPSY